VTSPATVPPPAAEPAGLTAAQAVDLLAILYAYRQASQDLRQRLADMITGLWWSLGQWRDRQREQFARDAVPIVEAAMAQMGSLTAGYLSAMQQQHTGRLVTPRPPRPPTIAGVRLGGVDPLEVYGRPFHLVWRQLAELPHEPGAIGQAVEAGLKRAVQTAHTDLQLAKTHTSRDMISGDRYAIGWRRVLEGPHSCGLCIVASTNTYHKAQLAAMHPGCDCDVAPIYVRSDTADRANRQIIGDVHQAIADRFGSSDNATRHIPGAVDGKGRPIDYKDVLITHQHGELGPVLAVKGQPFTGPQDLSKRRRRARTPRAGRTPEQIRAELTALERNLPRLTDDRQRSFTEARIATLREQLGGPA
jgi:hypothetical protein